MCYLGFSAIRAVVAFLHRRSDVGLQPINRTQVILQPTTVALLNQPTVAVLTPRAITREYMPNVVLYVWWGGCAV